MRSLAILLVLGMLSTANCQDIRVLSVNKDQALEKAFLNAEIMLEESKTTKPEDVVASKWIKPFSNPDTVHMEVIGMILMAFLIALSNAGGLSGAGSNIPIMLIFFNMKMNQAVPISAFVGVSATLLRFVINFSQKHPARQERVCINYEIVSLTMPSVFLGSFFGVMLGENLSDTTKMIIFGITVMWSIQTTASKACQQIEKEKKMANKDQLLYAQVTDSTAINNDEEGVAQINEAGDQFPQLLAIRHEEGSHFTSKKLIFTLICFVALFAVQFLYGGKVKKSLNDQMLPDWGRYLVLGIFVVTMLSMSKYSVENIKAIHEIKDSEGYNWHEQDTKFNSVMDIINLSVACAVAAILCGCTGIAGGMVLGPLFLKYNMNAQVMSGTNQYITLIASVSVAAQYGYLGLLNPYYSALFGITTVFCAMAGIKAVNFYVKKSGKQSVIMILLVIVLIMAVVALPINYMLKHADAKTLNEAPAATISAKTTS